MLYLPRLFVYHSSKKTGSESSEMLKIMERRLLRFIMNPAMISTFIFGVAITTIDPQYYGQAKWLQIKFILVLIMAGCHGYFAKCVKNFAIDKNQKSEKFYRVINEVPTILMIIIVFLAVIKP